MGFIEDARKLKQSTSEARENDTPDEQLLEELQKAQTRQNNKKELQNITEQIYQKTIKNMRDSTWQRIQINKNDFTDKDSVIDDLLYLVGIMSNDAMFYNINISKLKNHNPKH